MKEDHLIQSATMKQKQSFRYKIVNKLVIEHRANIE